MKYASVLVLLIVCLLVVDIEAWWSRGGRSRSRSRLSSRSRSSSRRQYSYDLNKKRLTNLYNSPVKRVESYSRPLSGVLGKVGLKHTGVVATTKDGGKWLIHKGPGYGKASSTVVTNAKHMSNQWKKTGSKPTNGKTISDLMKDGHVNKKYGVGPGRRICWQSSSNIMDKSGRRKRRAC